MFRCLNVSIGTLEIWTRLHYMIIFYLACLVWLACHVSCTITRYSPCVTSHNRTIQKYRPDRLCQRMYWIYWATDSTNISTDLSCKIHSWTSRASFINVATKVMISKGTMNARSPLLIFTGKVSGWKLNKQ